MKFDELPENNKICIYPWRGVHIDTTGEVQPCCMISRSQEKFDKISNSRLQDSRDNDIWKTIRQDLINGRENKHCTQCWQNEKHGHSYRKSGNLIHSDLLETIDFMEDGSLDNHDIAYWDIRNTNVCNMACVMCGNENSSMWQQESLKHAKMDSTGFHPTESYTITPSFNSDTQSFWPAVIDIGKDATNDILDEFRKNINKTTQVYFAGGEPLLNPIHYDILDMLIKHNRTDCKLFYNTNLLKIDHLGKSIMNDYWSKFAHVHVGSSIDAVGKRAEWARYGTKWQTVDTNMRRLIADANGSENILIGANVTHSFYTISGFCDLIEWFEEVGQGGGYINHNALTFPKQYVMKILPLEYRLHLKEEIYKTLNSTSIGHLLLNRGNSNSNNKGEQWKKLSYMLSEPEPDNVAELRKMAKGYITRLDSIRNKNILEACPELEDFWSEW
jgi:MoaA/NifB/PqqE/SkfB family radical SAM enzyme